TGVRASRSTSLSSRRSGSHGENLPSTAARHSRCPYEGCGDTKRIARRATTPHADASDAPPRGSRAVAREIATTPTVSAAAPATAAGPGRSAGAASPRASSQEDATTGDQPTPSGKYGKLEVITRWIPIEKTAAAAKRMRPAGRSRARGMARAGKKST